MKHMIDKQALRKIEQSLGSVIPPSSRRRVHSPTQEMGQARRPASTVAKSRSFSPAIFSFNRAAAMMGC
jgi:hypothetical protein